MSDPKFQHNISIQEQSKGGFLIQWRSLEDGRMTHSTVRETKEGVLKLIKELLEG